MTLEDQYGVGDTVDLGSATGTVVAVSLRTTTAAGRRWHDLARAQRRGAARRQLQPGRGRRPDLSSRCPMTPTARGRRDRPASRPPRSSQDEEFAAAIIEPPKLLGIVDVTPGIVTIGLTATVRAGDQDGYLRAVRAAIKSAFDQALADDPGRTSGRRWSPRRPRPADGRPESARSRPNRRAVRDNDPVTAPATFYDEIGGHPVFAGIVERFYAAVADRSRAAPAVSGGGPGAGRGAAPDVSRAVLGRPAHLLRPARTPPAADAARAVRDRAARTGRLARRDAASPWTAPDWTSSTANGCGPTWRWPRTAWSTR